MFEYKFIKINHCGDSFFGLLETPDHSYRKIIHEQAKEGWELVQIFAPPITRHGAALFYDLIFKRPSQDSTGSSDDC